MEEDAKKLNESLLVKRNVVYLLNFPGTVIVNDLNLFINLSRTHFRSHSTNISFM